MKQQMKQYVLFLVVTAVLSILVGCAPTQVSQRAVEPAAGETAVETARSAAAVRPDSFAFYTERYWEMSAGSVSRPESAGDAFYTEQYWKLADAGAAADVLIVESAGDAFYTEQYWKLAGESAATVQPQRDAFYTEQYWQMAEQYAASAETAPKGSFAYYSEQYWQLSK